MIQARRSDAYLIRENKPYITTALTYRLLYGEFTPAMGASSHLTTINSGMDTRTLKILTIKHILAAPVQFSFNLLFMYEPVQAITASKIKGD